MQNKNFIYLIKNAKSQGMEKYRKRLSEKIRENMKNPMFFHTIMTKRRQIYQNNVPKTKNKDKNAKKVLHISGKCSNINSRKRLSKPVKSKNNKQHRQKTKHAKRHHSLI